MSLIRCSVAAIGVSILQKVLDHIGPGWTFTLLGALGIVAAPMLWLVWLWGMIWRTERSDQLRDTGFRSETGIAEHGESDNKERSDNG